MPSLTWIISIWKITCFSYMILCQWVVGFWHFKATWTSHLQWSTLDILTTKEDETTTLSTWLRKPENLHTSTHHWMNVLRSVRNWKWSERKRLWPNVRHYPGIYTLSNEIIKYLCLDSESSCTFCIKCQKHYCLKDVPGLMQLPVALPSQTLGSTPGQATWDLWWMKQQWDRLSSKYFYIPLRVSFYKTSILTNSPITVANKSYWQHH